MSAEELAELIPLEEVLPQALPGRHFAPAETAGIREFWNDLVRPDAVEDRRIMTYSSGRRVRQWQPVLPRQRATQQAVQAVLNWNQDNIIRRQAERQQLVQQTQQLDGALQADQGLAQQLATLTVEAAASSQ